MATKALGRQEFLRSEKADVLRAELQSMVDDPQYNTVLRYSILSPDGSRFVTKHLDYMSNHLQMNHGQYLSNLKLMTKINSSIR